MFKDEVRWTDVSAREHASAKRRVRNNDHTKLPSRGKKANLLGLDNEFKCRVFGFDNSDGVDCVCPAERVAVTVRDTDVFDFAFPGKIIIR